MKTYCGSARIKLSIRQRCVFSFTPRPLYHRYTFLYEDYVGHCSLCETRDWYALCFGSWLYTGLQVIA